MIVGVSLSEVCLCQPVCADPQCNPGLNVRERPVVRARRAFVA